MKTFCSDLRLPTHVNYPFYTYSLNNLVIGQAGRLAELETFNQERETIRRTTLAGAKRELHTERNYNRSLTGWEGPEETNQVTGCLKLGRILISVCIRL
jgi:hypothetical protein